MVFNGGKHNFAPTIRHTTAMKEILKYFPRLSQRQRGQMELLDKLYREWNERINVVSRKDIDQLYVHHVLHSLAIAAYTTFDDGAEILDVGTGGGFPGIPLAIMFPQCHFKLIDSIGKKVRVAREVAAACGLRNCEVEQRRVQEEHGRYDAVVSRAVTGLPALVAMTRKNIACPPTRTASNADGTPARKGESAHGIICLKGGDLTEELAQTAGHTTVVPVSTWFDEPWFEGKYVVEVAFDN